MSANIQEGNGMVNSKDDSFEQYWFQRWNEGYIGFHRPTYNPKFVRYVDHLITGRKQLKCFFPFCGKSMDMMWMYNEGHSVVGVEISSRACNDFFLENDIPYVQETVEEAKGMLYKSKDNRIRLYCCNILNFKPSVERDMDAVFDRGGFGSMNSRSKYSKMLTSLMHKKCRYILFTFHYDQSKFKGPPYSIEMSELTSIYGSSFNIELLGTEDCSAERYESFGVDKVEEQVYLLTTKS